MKKYILFLFLISVASVSAQVGINIASPNGVFHIDSNKDSPTTVSDDILVDANGNIGVGTVLPTAKMHIVVPNGSSALRIQDGTQAADRILMSDANGNATWGVIKGSGGYAMPITATKTFPNGTGTIMPLDGTNTKISIITAGNYLITIRWWGATSAISSAGTTSAYFTLLKNGTSVDNIEYYVPAAANIPFTFTTVLMATNCISGDYLEIKVLPSVGGQSWIINGSGMINPSMTVFRM